MGGQGRDVAVAAWACRVVGRRAQLPARADLVGDALEQALHPRRPVAGRGLVRHADRGSRHVSVRATERLAEAGIEPAIGSLGESDANAFAKTVTGWLETEVIHGGDPWRCFDAVASATIERVDGFATRRLPGPIGILPPEAEARLDRRTETSALAA